MNNSAKSATTAGLLGIFLGGVGAHNWYLGEKKKGIIHVSLVAAGIVIMLIADAIIPAVFSLRTAFSLAGILAFLNLVSGILITGSSFWGFIEGIQILTKGDAGLAQRGFPVAGNPMSQGTMPQGGMPQGAMQQHPTQNPAQTSTEENAATNAMGPSAGMPEAGTQTADAQGTTGAGMGQETAATGNTTAENATTGDITMSNKTMSETTGQASWQGAQGTQAMMEQPNAPKAPKAPMDPAKKKKIILGVVIAAAAVVVATIVVVVISIVTTVHYGEAYRVAKEIKPEMAEFYQNTSCKRVVDYLDEEYIDVSSYNEYATKCMVAGGELSELTKKLGETEGVKKNKEIKAQYDKFNEGIEKTLPNRDELEKKLEIYKAWHGFVVTEVKLDSTNSEVEAKTDFLINSGNETLKQYGEGWKEKVLALMQAYREYQDLPYLPADVKSAARKKYQDLQTDQKNWVTENKPNVAELGGLNFDDNTKVYNEWTKLYKLIQTTYEENYDSDSGDCVELFGEVVCD